MIKKHRKHISHNYAQDDTTVWAGNPALSTSDYLHLTCDACGERFFLGFTHGCMRTGVVEIQCLACGATIVLKCPDESHVINISGAKRGMFLSFHHGEHNDQETPQTDTS